jgi:hypothetical protein
LATMSYTPYGWLCRVDRQKATRIPEDGMLHESAGYPCFSGQRGQMRPKALLAMSTITGNMIGNESTTLAQRLSWADCGVLKCLQFKLRI